MNSREPPHHPKSTALDMVFGIPVMISETDVIKRRLAAGDDAGDSLLALLLIPAGGAFVRQWAKQGRVSVLADHDDATEDAV